MKNIDDKKLRAIGKRINDLRIEKRMSIQELADKANIERSNLSRISTKGSNFTLLTLLKIITALECEPNDIIL
ncbi:helix-turn-helix domain-containing protein [Aquimarina addita]